MKIIYKLEHSGEAVVGVHSKMRCKGEPCTIHNMTEHRMRGFPQHWRDDRGIMERICPHGIGHPDPDDYKCRNSNSERVHGCDGCCLPRLRAQFTDAEIEEMNG